MTRIQQQKLVEFRKDGWNVPYQKEERFGGNVAISKGSTLATVKPDGTVEYHKKKKG